MYKRFIIKDIFLKECSCWVLLLRQERDNADYNTVHSLLYTILKYETLLPKT